jgi:hypothetical protein
MAERILKGKEETINASEAWAMAENSMTELLFYITGMVDDLTEDEEERSTAKVNLSQMVGKMSNGYFLAGLLADPDKYIAETFPEGVGVSIV